MTVKVSILFEDTCNGSVVHSRGLHGDGDDGNTAVLCGNGDIVGLKYHSNCRDGDGFCGNTVVVGMNSCGITAGAVFYSTDCPVQPIRVHYVTLVKCSTWPRLLHIPGT